MSKNYTACAWVKLEPGGHYDQVLFSNSANGVSATLVLLLRRQHPYLAHLHNDTVANERVKFSEWAHVTFRFNSGEQAIYVNGRLAVASSNHSILASNQPLEIGRWNKRYLKGRLSDIRIYDTALHSKDILKLYELTRSSE